jgi:hypothetical protein
LDNINAHTDDSKVINKLAARKNGRNAICHSGKALFAEISFGEKRVGILSVNSN